MTPVEASTYVPPLPLIDVRNETIRVTTTNSDKVYVEVPGLGTGQIDLQCAIHLYDTLRIVLKQCDCQGLNR